MHVPSFLSAALIETLEYFSAITQLFFLWLFEYIKENLCYGVVCPNRTVSFLRLVFLQHIPMCLALLATE